MSSYGELRYIVRILGTDIDGSLKIPYGLAKIRGVGINLGYAIARAAGVDTELRIGELTDEQVRKLEEVAKNPTAYGIPSWMLNRRFDPVTGKDLQLYGADLELSVKEDIQREMRIKSWRGVRHSLGLKVRGQRTRTTGRKGRTVGVSKRRQ
ncbi:MAG TPA: 30S ribosomal protein S13 [Candidatus Caldiarchaeum subterraneum]|uniref:Small ribosomal subunit protein uS13 n=1 Tax=Caldiarchaeum subterraneum TaxID=311458 RepID=A0A833ECQ5_CALS0|nr:30S ribosomal protein S13 [Candidatus Caldarchaeum subterraneum]